MCDNFITSEMLFEISSNKSKVVEILLHKDSSFTANQDNINSLPRDIHDKIVEHYKNLLPSKYVLREWVPKDKLDWFALSGNPCATDILMEKADYENSLTEEEYNSLETKNKINWMKLCRCQKSIDIFKKYPLKILWAYLSDNDYQPIVDMILEKFEYEKINPTEIDEDNRISFLSFTDNHNPNIMKLVTERIEYEKGLSKEEYDKLDICVDVLDWAYLSGNPSAIDLLKENIDKINWEELSCNTNPNAIDLLRERTIEENNMSKKDYAKLKNKINWNVLSTNPNAIELLEENIHKINWEYLSANSGAINLLKKYPNAINWSYLSGNPNAIEILKVNIKNIEWFMLSKNPNAIELLKANRKKINWKALSLNENAFELIKERVEYESKLSPKKYENLNPNNRLDWKRLSANKGIFKLV